MHRRFLISMPQSRNGTPFVPRAAASASLSETSKNEAAREAANVCGELVQVAVSLPELARPTSGVGGQAP